MKRGKEKPWVKKNLKGSLSITLKQVTKSLLRKLLEEAINKPVYPLPLATTYLTDHFIASIADEIYTKYFAELSLYRDGKIILSRTQALGLWAILDDANLSRRLTPPVGNLHMQLHQKLS